MLEGSKISTRCLDAPSRRLFDFKTKEPLLSLGPITYLRPVYTFELASDLEKCLDLLTCTPSEEFEMDLSLPDIRLNTFAPNNKLKILPEKIDYSKLLSFESESGLDPVERLPIAEQQSVRGQEEDCELYFIADVDQGYAELKEVIVSDNREPQSLVQPSSGLFTGLFKNRFLSSTSMRNFFGDANQKRIRLAGHGCRKCKLLTTDDVRLILEQMDQDLPRNLSAISSTGVTTPTNVHLAGKKINNFPLSVYEENINCCRPSRKSEEFNIPVENETGLIDPLIEESVTSCDSPIDDTVPDNIEVFVNDIVSSKHHAEDQELILHPVEVNNVISLNEEVKDSIHNEGSVNPVFKESESESDVEPEDSLIGKTEDEMIDPIAIKETGVQIFREPTNLFVFDHLKLWKKIGEGRIEIWRQPESGNCYMLLWDKNTGNLLVHMQVDGKWSVNYLPKSSNSCRWVYYNYANCPKGIREPLACRFRDSNVASQFVHTVTNCLDKTSLN
ncbi:uncharacterized protein Sprn [Drosophila montana]|uniref:uncharacterized protein Sprn n=1 Tax=Drosophila montana TaxID=40370 RepID=UPI00313B1842